ncbi:hypothetical protein Tco_1134168, partial [Tanacetum coccineum]
MDSEATDASTQQNPKKIDEEYTIIAYPNVQENLKLPTEDQVIIEEPASSTKTLSSLQNLDKELSFTNNSLWRSHRKKNLRKPILNQSLHIGSCTTSNINNNNHNNHNNNISSTTTTSTISKHLRSNAIEAHRDLPTVDLKEILQQQMFEDNSYKAHDVHNDLYEALQKSLELDYSNQGLADQEEDRKMKRKRRESPRTPPGSPPSQPPSPSPPTGALGALATRVGVGFQNQGGVAPSSSKTAASTHQSMAWTTSHTRYESTGFTATYETSPSDDLMHDDFILDEQVHLSNDEDSRNDHLPKDNVRTDWWKPLPEKENTIPPFTPPENQLGSFSFRPKCIPDDLQHSFRNSDACYHDPEKCEHAGSKVTTIHGGNTTTRMIKRFTMADDLKESSKITQVKGTKFKDHYIIEAEAMVSDVSDLKIKTAMFGIGDCKAPGLDDYTACFFKKAWLIVGNDVCLAIKEFFMTGKLLKEINSTLIALFPKIHHPKLVTDFRPIACFNLLGLKRLHRFLEETAAQVHNGNYAK